MIAAEILNKHNLKRTSCREGIIETIMAEGVALSEKEIRDKLASTYDRVTIYRSFKTLEEKHILHKIVVDNQLVKYALDNSITKKSDHAHFYCNKCEKVICYSDIEIFKSKLPDGFIEQETEILIKGICKDCSN